MMHTLWGHPSGFTALCINMYRGFSEESNLGLVNININNLIQLLGNLKLLNFNL